MINCDNLIIAGCRAKALLLKENMKCCSLKSGNKNVYNRACVGHRAKSEATRLDLFKFKHSEIFSTHPPNYSTNNGFWSTSIGHPPLKGVWHTCSMDNKKLDSYFLFSHGHLHNVLERLSELRVLGSTSVDDE